MADTDFFVRPEPPYYAVIITTRLGDELAGYAETDRRMGELGRAQPGYLGRESMTDHRGEDLVVLYYDNAESVAAWKAHPEHLEAQRLGRERWYASYSVEVARVERGYSFQRAGGGPCVSERRNPVTADVLVTFDEVRDRVLARLDGMSDAEYLWEPVPGCLTVRPGADGVSRADDRPLGGGSGPAPFSTVAWRMWHIGADCLRGYGRFFGEQPAPDEDRQRWPATAEGGVAALAEAFAHFRAHVTALGDTRLIRPMGALGGSYGHESYLVLATHAIDEAAHHGAELAVLRDLCAHGLGPRPATPPAP